MFVVGSASVNLRLNEPSRRYFVGFTSELVFSASAVTFVPVSKVNGRAEVDDILAAVRPATCLVTLMLANNETGVVMVSRLAP